MNKEASKVEIVAQDIAKEIDDNILGETFDGIGHFADRQQMQKIIIKHLIKNNLSWQTKKKHT